MKEFFKSIVKRNFELVIKKRNKAGGGKMESKKDEKWKKKDYPMKEGNYMKEEIVRTGKEEWTTRNKRREGKEEWGTNKWKEEYTKVNKNKRTERGMREMKWKYTNGKRIARRENGNKQREKGEKVEKVKLYLICNVGYFPSIKFS